MGPPPPSGVRSTDRARSGCRRPRRDPRASSSSRLPAPLRRRHSIHPRSVDRRRFGRGESGPSRRRGGAARGVRCIRRDPRRGARARRLDASARVADGARPRGLHGGCRRRRRRRARRGHRDESGRGGRRRGGGDGAFRRNIRVLFRRRREATTRPVLFDDDERRLRPASHSARPRAGVHVYARRARDDAGEDVEELASRLCRRERGGAFVLVVRPSSPRGGRFRGARSRVRDGGVGRVGRLVALGRRRVDGSPGRRVSRGFTPARAGDGGLGERRDAAARMARRVRVLRGASRSVTHDGRSRRGGGDRASMGRRRAVFRGLRGARPIGDGGVRDCVWTRVRRGGGARESVRDHPSHR